MYKFSRGAVLITVFLIIVAAAGGYAVGTTMSNPLTKAPGIANINPTNSQNSTKNLAMLHNQTATIQGKVTAVNGKNLSIQDPTGARGEFQTIEKPTIMYYLNPKTSSSSADLAKVQLNELAIITLLLENGEYKVKQVQYYPPAAATTAPKATATPATNGGTR